jgi:subtilisin family serine protease
VKLKSLNDTILLKQKAEKEHAIIVYQNSLRPLWFAMSVTVNSTSNAMELANRFYESGLFQNATPDLMEDITTVCANDTYFEDQWGLKNTGQYGGIFGIDIKACDAWQIATGSNVIVAVVDQGVVLDHPDLEANIYPLSFDSESGTSPQIVYTGLIDSNHGTPCAGIIGAIKNNEIGIAGVATDCKLMSVSNSFEGTPFSQMKVADGIDWAWQNGADIISNSWYATGAYDEITEAINNAVIQGRDGKGCVVLFASGNFNANSVVFPACLPNVIAVGAITYNGNRAAFSNYGFALDIVAPGVDISTTKGPKAPLQQEPHPEEYLDTLYRRFFGGTSAACPHVSGVAALVLSANPNLTGQEVRDIIESTAQKVRTDLYNYNYDSIALHPNGTWNNEVGHGLVNAYDAVCAARCYSGLPIVIVDGPIIQNTTWNTPVHAVGSTIIPNGITLTVTSQVKCDIDTRITIHPGGKLIIDGGVLTNACENEMWQGITVIGDIKNYSCGIVELRNGGTIENALVGIHAVSGGIIEANNAYFINNKVGTLIDMDSEGDFTNTQFVINSHYPGGNSSVCQNFDVHLRLYGCKPVTVSGCMFINHTDQVNANPLIHQ